MKKSDKKIEQQIVNALTEVCETSLKQLSGFEWLTHTVNYKSFPNSLRVYCVFDTTNKLTEFRKSEHKAKLTKLIQTSLFSVGVDLNKPLQQIRFDSEEKCSEEHKGNWSKRLS